MNHPHRFGHSHGSVFHHDSFHHHHDDDFHIGIGDSGDNSSGPIETIDPDVKMGLLILLVVAIVGLWVYLNVVPEIRRKIRARRYDRDRKAAALARELSERHPDRETVGPRR